jgi:ParB family chromosome partitioning protein
MSTKRTDIKLPSVDDLFKTQESRINDEREKIMDIPLPELHPFKNHPFQVNDNEELRELAKSIKENGVVSPAIARPRPEGGYELIAGHRRKAASQIAGLDTMPVIVRELDDEAATIVMVDSNQQRENLLPSEKAFSYKMKLDAMKRVAGRPSKENGGQVDHNLRGIKSRDIIANDSNDSAKQIERYIRLTYLVPEILKKVDEKNIAFNPAVELSYLPKEVQKTLLEAMEVQQCTPSLSQAQRMKTLHQEGKLELDMIFKILGEAKANQREKISFSHERLQQYFPKGYTPKQMEESIIKLLEERQRRLQRNCGEER